MRPDARCRVLACALLLCASTSTAQKPFLSSLSATGDSPLFTTYAAAEARSEFTLDKGYHLQLEDPARGADLTCESAGDICIAFRCNGRFVYALREMARGPVVTASYSDLVTYTLFPFDSVRAEVMFLVYSSHHAVQSVSITNYGTRPRALELIPFLRNRNRPYRSIEFRRDMHAVTCAHAEQPDRWVLQHGIPFVGDLRDALSMSDLPDRMLMCETPGEVPADTGATGLSDTAHVVGMACRMQVRAGETRTTLIVRSVGRPGVEARLLIDTAGSLMATDIRGFLAADEKLYSTIVPLPSADTDRQMLYWSAFSLMRQAMLPPEGKCRENYYVFSREPQWGWGHGGQVFHESLTMLSYALMDPRGAMRSQRVYMERQHPDGYINYRTGPYLDEQIPTGGELTTSAPWYSWENWEIYRVTRDRQFLEDAYASGASFYQYLLRNRDADGDGLCEWGGHAVLESVRDGDVAVWDQVGWPSGFEDLDLNAMMVGEAKSLVAMAMVLGRQAEAEEWQHEVQQRCTRINALMWDSSSGFYYNIDRKTHTFSSKSPGDLKRQEIIGFLPLWAGIATKSQAEKLVAVLTDTSKFWRRFGVPSLAADDPYYNPRGYWNGPVWVQWNFLIVRGLLEYGYARQARELTDRVASALIAQLRKDHNFWEFYSPDAPWAGYHRTYLWCGLISRMLLEVSQSAGD